MSTVPSCCGFKLAESMHELFGLKQVSIERHGYLFIWFARLLWNHVAGIVLVAGIHVGTNNV